MRRYGLLGEHLGHSFSPQIHKMIGGYDYDLFERSPEELEEFLRSGPFDAINVTKPGTSAASIPLSAARMEVCTATIRITTAFCTPFATAVWM